MKLWWRERVIWLNECALFLLFSLVGNRATTLRERQRDSFETGSRRATVTSSGRVVSGWTAVSCLTCVRWRCDNTNLKLEVWREFIGFFYMLYLSRPETSAASSAFRMHVGEVRKETEQVTGTEDAHTPRQKSRHTKTFTLTRTNKIQQEPVLQPS